MRPALQKVASLPFKCRVEQHTQPTKWLQWDVRPVHLAYLDIGAKTAHAGRQGDGPAELPGDGELHSKARGVARAGQVHSTGNRHTLTSLRAHQPWTTSYL